LKQIQSIDYLAPSSRVYRQWLSAQPWRRYWDRWFMMAAIGIAVGITGFLLHLLIHVLAVVKITSTR
jgi:chloride channel 7